ncbi:MAG: histidine phosphatase family protein [Marinovum algicola]|uniref:Phosphohistidine phosphatase n=1 Tax=Marinovum algicola TaxID=42444 RepID=A0A975W6D5_9RHOB|nr:MULTISPECIES: histidine phosphatase family protein [Marinovum]MDD9743498.1 histidine phosphatase family protein [Marinovum sp. PR37]SEI51275.1 phosphohistidine phosphatase [Marinovum algicola]SLN30454.1 2,3-bisphosphoglycerate-dependent phosphoglycerate mutase [Marinovum algicola]
MTLRLILMRHTKSSWDDPWQGDHARRLNGRGRRSAEALGNWLRAKGHLPDVALSSDAVRTQETFAGLALACPVRFTPALYLADTGTMLERLRQAESRSVLLIGHNPGIGAFAGRLVATAPDHPKFDPYPTGATLVAEFAAESWAGVDYGTASVLDFVVPRELV